LVQLPQCARSVDSETQVPLHPVVPASQTQLPPLQIWDALQAVAQAPQCLASLPWSTHPPEHSTSGAVHEVVH
jgi:hypothetical protein